MPTLRRSLFRFVVAFLAMLAAAIAACSGGGEAGNGPPAEGGKQLPSGTPVATVLVVQLDPDFATDPWARFTVSEDGKGGTGTALARGRLLGSALKNLTVL